jgi:hypothetical protein
MNIINIKSIVGVGEIAAKAGVTKQAVCNWRKRYPDFPKPIKELASGPIFDLEQVKRFLKI